MIVVSEETEKSMKVTWQPAPGNVLNYRVTYKPKSGGRQLAAKVPGGNTSTVLRRLTPLTTYDITVLPVYRSGEGKTREGEGTTCTLVYYSPHHKRYSVAKLRKSQTSPSQSSHTKWLKQYYSFQLKRFGFECLITQFCTIWSNCTFLLFP